MAIFPTKLLMLHHLNFSIQLDGTGTTEFLMSMTTNEAPHLDGGINVTRETQQPLPFEILCQRLVLKMVSNMYIAGHILNGWPRVPLLIRSCNGNPGRWGAPFSDSTPHTHTPSTHKSLLLHTISYSSELSRIQSRTEKKETVIPQAFQE